VRVLITLDDTVTLEDMESKRISLKPHFMPNRPLMKMAIDWIKSYLPIIGLFKKQIISKMYGLRWIPSEKPAPKVMAF